MRCSDHSHLSTHRRHPRLSECLSVLGGRAEEHHFTPPFVSTTVFARVSHSRPSACPHYCLPRASRNPLEACVGHGLRGTTTTGCVIGSPRLRASRWLLEGEEESVFASSLSVVQHVLSAVVCCLRLCPHSCLSACLCLRARRSLFLLRHSLSCSVLLSVVRAAARTAV